jgi:hypothetical protein
MVRLIPYLASYVFDRVPYALSTLSWSGARVRAPAGTCLSLGALSEDGENSSRVSS